MNFVDSLSGLHACTIQTPLGEMWLAGSDAGLAGAWFTDQRHCPNDDERIHWRWTDPPGHPILEQAHHQLNGYFSCMDEAIGSAASHPNGGCEPFSLRLDLRKGTAFQQMVWRMLLEIDFGQVTSYGALAEAMGKPGAARAVGLAVGRNPVSVIVPCHRVLGNRRALTGYAGGLERKSRLLLHEGVVL